MYVDSEARRAEDQAFLNEAISLGRINEKNRAIWAAAMLNDRSGTRNVISSMPSEADRVAENPTYQAWKF